MNTSPGHDTGFSISQDYEVLQPVSGKAYPILCEEWNYLKVKIAAITDKLDVYQVSGSVLLGAAITTFTANVTGLTPMKDANGALLTTGIISWAVFGAALVTGAACLLLSHRAKCLLHTAAKDVVSQMEIIEKRFPH